MAFSVLHPVKSPDRDFLKLKTYPDKMESKQEKEAFEMEIQKPVTRVYTR